MKDAPLSQCERSFIVKAIKQNQRLDGRKNDEFRKVNINFGARWGSAVVTMGDTKVVSEVSCELSVPKTTRPTEGNLFINVELRSMAAPTMDGTRSSEMAVKLNRTLERTFKDSRCVDLESLCVVAEERVWSLRVDLVVLNNDGNLIDCCAIATLCSLAHFKRPDVSIVEDNVVIYTAAEKEPISMVLHHYPICVSYCTFDEGRIAIADPTALEERTAESQMIFGLNSLQELCCFNLGGSTLTSSFLLLQCAKRASIYAKSIVQRVKAKLVKDAELRNVTKHINFAQQSRLQKICTLADEDDLSLRVRDFSFKDVNESMAQKEAKPVLNFESDNESEPDIVFSLDAQTAVLNSNQCDVKWIPDENESGNLNNSDGCDESDDEISEQKLENMNT